MNDMEREDAQALLASTQQLRTHWSGVITSHFSLSLTINVAIWSYFVTSYIGSIKNGLDKEPIFLYVASSLSSLLLGLWRLYTRHIDDHIANLYPDFLMCEGILKVPADRGTGGYLIKAVPGLDRLLNEELSLENKVKAISRIIKLKRVGDRGHFKINLFTLLAIILMFFLSFLLMSPFEANSFKYEFLLLLGNLFGLIFIFVAMKSFQRNPCDRQVEDLFYKYRNKKDNSKDT